MSWYTKSGEHNDIVVSTRVRLARNINGIPFPEKMTPEQFENLNKIVSDALIGSNTPF